MVDDAFCQQLLDRLAEEKHVQRQAMRFQRYIPSIDAWKRRRAHTMPNGRGLTEDVSHICTKECRDNNMIDTIVPHKVYGCMTSGLIHICNRDSDCKYHFNDGDGLKKCIFSAKHCGDSYSHSWAPHDLYDKKGTDYSGNGTPERGIYDGTVPGVNGMSTDGVLLSSSRQGYGSKKRDNMENDVDEGWIVDFGKQLDDVIAYDDSDDEFIPEDDSNDYGTTATIMSRKARLIDELGDDKNRKKHAVPQSTINPSVLGKGVTSMNDVMMVASSPARSPYMITGLSKSAPISPSSPFYPSATKTPSLREIVSSPLSSSPNLKSPSLSSSSPSIKLGSPCQFFHGWKIFFKIFVRFYPLLTVHP